MPLAELVYSNIANTAVCLTISTLLVSIAKLVELKSRLRHLQRDLEEVRSALQPLPRQPKS